MLAKATSEFFQTFFEGKRNLFLSCDLTIAAGPAAFEKLALRARAVANNLRGDQRKSLA